MPCRHTHDKELLSHRILWRKKITSLEDDLSEKLLKQVLFKARLRRAGPVGGTAAPPQQQPVQRAKPLNRWINKVADKNKLTDMIHSRSKCNCLDCSASHHLAARRQMVPAEPLVTQPAMLHG